MIFHLYLEMEIFIFGIGIISLYISFSASLSKMFVRILEVTVVILIKVEIWISIWYKVMNLKKCWFCDKNSDNKSLVIKLEIRIILERIPCSSLYRFIGSIQMLTNLPFLKIFLFVLAQCVKDSLFCKNKSLRYILNSNQISGISAHKKWKSHKKIGKKELRKRRKL